MDEQVLVTRPYALGPDFELSVLASVVLDPTFLSRYWSVVSPDMFSLPVRAFVVETTISLFTKYKTTPGREALKDAIRRSSYRDRADAVQLVDALSPPTDAGYVADRVVEWCRWSAIDNVIEGAPRDDPRRFADSVDRASRIGDSLLTNYLTLNDDGDVDQVRRRQIATPWSWLNQRMLGGPELQDFIVIMSFVNVGKTTMLVNVAGHAVGLGERVVYFTFEDGETKIKRRFMQWIGRWTTEDVMRDYKRACRLRDLFLEQSNGGQLIIKKLQSRRSTVEDCMTFVKAMNEEGDKPVSTVITDYMDRFGVQFGTKGEPRHRLREIAEDCKYMAGELDVVHWSATQAQRGRAGKDVVSIEHVGESLGKVEGCDGAIGLGQTLEMERTERAKIFTAKLRDHKKHEEHVLSFKTGVQRVTELGEA